MRKAVRTKRQRHDRDGERESDQHPPQVRCPIALLKAPVVRLLRGPLDEGSWAQAHKVILSKKVYVYL